MLEKQLHSLLQTVIHDLFETDIQILLEAPRMAEHGDLACPIAMGLSKKLKKNPREIAQQIVEKIPENDLLKKIEIAGPGFLNFTFTEEAVTKAFQVFDTEKMSPVENPKKVVLDFSHPNIAKPLHFGHFRSTVIGESLVRLLRYVGHNVLADSYLGDWGTNFGKLIVAIRTWGDEEKIKTHPIKELTVLYQKFHEEAEKNPDLEKQAAAEFLKMEKDRDPENFKLWEWIRESSLKELQKFYDLIDAHFDCIRGEYFYEHMLTKVIAELEEKKVAQREEGGALVVHYPEETKLPSLIFQKSDGGTLYQTRDVARIKYYSEKNFDEMIQVVASEQYLYFRQVFTAAEISGWKAHLRHAQFGMVLGMDGKKFSTRKGNGIGLDEVIEEALTRMSAKVTEHQSEILGKEREELVKILAIGALKFNDLGQGRQKDIVFDWEKMLDFNGYSGPFLQYSAVRCKSILRKAGAMDTEFLLQDLKEPEELALAKKILDFPKAVSLSAEMLEPHHLAQYLFELASTFNRFYAACSVLSADTEEEKQRRLALTQKTGEALEKGLWLLGIQTPERM